MSVDIERVKTARADPILDWEAGFTLAMFRDGWFSSAWRVIAIIFNAAPVLITRIQELEAEVAKAKALGAAEELERMADALRELTTEDCSPAIGEDDLRRKAAQLRKGLA